MMVRAESLDEETQRLLRHGMQNLVSAIVEVTGLTLFGRPVAPAGAHVGNPAFDVTPFKYVTGIVTEHNVVYPPFDINLRRAVEAEQGKVRSRLNSRSES